MLWTLALSKNILQHHSYAIMCHSAMICKSLTGAWEAAAGSSQDGYHSANL